MDSWILSLRSATTCWNNFVQSIEITLTTDTHYSQRPLSLAEVIRSDAHAFDMRESGKYSRPRPGPVPFNAHFREYL